MGDEGQNSRIADVPATQADPIYGIGDVLALTGISAFTIRYYDKCGFFPNLHRDKRGVRTFSEADVAQLHLVERLCKRGGTTRAERLSILRAQETVLEYQREELDESLKRLHAATVDLEAAERSQGHGML